MRINIGNVTAVNKRYLDVKVKSTGQTLKGVVKVLPLDLDEREEEAYIRVGAEIIMLTDDHNNSYALGTTSQGINLAEGIASIEQNHVNIHGYSTIKIHNNAHSLIPTIADFTQAMADLAQAVADTTPTGGSSAGKPNAMEATALSIKNTALEIKGKLETFGS